VNPDLGIYPRDVLERVFSRSMEAHSLMQRANMLKLDDECLQAMKGLACSQQHADCYCIFHTLPCLMLVFRACLRCTYNTPYHTFRVLQCCRWQVLLSQGQLLDGASAVTMIAAYAAVCHHWKENSCTYGGPASSDAKAVVQPK